MASWQKTSLGLSILLLTHRAGPSGSKNGPQMVRGWEKVDQGGSACERVPRPALMVVWVQGLLWKEVALGLPPSAYILRNQTRSGVSGTLVIHSVTLKSSWTPGAGTVLSTEDLVPAKHKIPACMGTSAPAGRCVCFLGLL